MPEQIYMPISSNLFVRIQRLTIPPVFDSSPVIEMLIDHWEADTANNRVISTPLAVPTKPNVWRSPRGDSLPVGATLQAQYLRKTFCAKVEKNGILFAGKLYDSLSAASVAVKQTLGRIGRAASTDGRKFWKIQDPNSNRWTSISSSRPIAPVVYLDVEAMLAEIKGP